MIADIHAAAVAASGKNNKRAALRYAGMVLSLLLLVSVMGCTPKVYNVNMRYQPTKVIRPAGAVTRGATAASASGPS